MKIRKIVLAIIISICLLCTSAVGATSLGALNLTTDASTTPVQQGETFTVMFSITDLDSGFSITGIDGYIYIDPDIYEEISIDNFTSLAEGLQIVDNISSGYNSNTMLVNMENKEEGIYHFAIDYFNGINSDTDLFEIALTVKDGVASGAYTYTIIYSDAEIASGSDVLGYPDDSAPLVLIGDIIYDEETGEIIGGSTNTGTAGSTTVGGTDSSDSETVTGTEGSTSTGSTSTTGTTTSTGKTEYDTTVASGTLPNTGYKLLIVPVLILIALGIVFFKKYRSYKEI